MAYGLEIFSIHPNFQDGDAEECHKQRAIALISPHKPSDATKSTHHMDAEMRHARAGVIKEHRDLIVNICWTLEFSTEFQRKVRLFYRL